MHGAEVVHAAGGEELAVDAEGSGRLRVRDAHVVAEHVVGGDAREPGQVAEHVGVGGRARAEDRGHVALRIQSEPVRVDAAVEVHGELREAQQRAGADEVTGSVPHHEAAGELEVAVEPGVEERAAVDLDAGLDPAVGSDGGLRLQLEAGGVGVGAEHAEGRGGVRAGGLDPREERAVADDEPSPGAGGPGVALVESGEARGLEAARALLGRVEGGGGGLDEAAEVREVRAAVGRHQ